MNKEVMIKDEKRTGGAAVAVEGGKSKRQKKSKASKFPRVNPLAVTVAGDSSSPVEGTNTPGPISAQVTVASGVPTTVQALTRPRGIAVPVAGSEDENVIEKERIQRSRPYSMNPTIYSIRPRKTLLKGALRNQVFFLTIPFYSPIHPLIWFRKCRAVNRA